MKYYSLFLFLFINTLYAQVSGDVSEVTSDVVTVLSTGVILGDTNSGCHEEDKGSIEEADYICDCEHDQHPPKRAHELVPREHVLHKNHGIQLLDIGADVKAVNDNNQLFLIDKSYGDDSGNTFGGDINLYGTLKDLNDNKIKVGLNYQMRQYTMPLEGNTYLDFDTGNVSVYGKDEYGNHVLINQTVRDGLKEEYGDRDYLSNQASMTLQVLEVNMMVEPPRADGKIGLNYGLGIGYKDLNDTADQMGANIQDWHHSNMGIYRFEWDTFSNMIVDGRESYLTLRPRAQVEFPTLEAGSCRLQSNADFSVLFNTPIRNTGGDRSLNLIEPKASLNFTLGMIPLDEEKSAIEWRNSLVYDPMNRAPTNLDPGNKGYFRSGLKFNFNLNKRTQLYLIPIEFYIPLGDQADDHLLSGGHKDGATVAYETENLLKKQLANDVIGTWAQAGIVIKLGK
tara:strand:- start:18148 stop:19506 length:1359 start_codon:yes stop_codon:yes gene_type:complete